MTMMAEPERPGELPERWSAKTKSDVVLRLSAAGLSRTSHHHATSHHQQQWGKPQQQPSSPSYTKLQGTRCLTHIDREGWVARSCARWASSDTLVYRNGA